MVVRWAKSSRPAGAYGIRCLPTSRESERLSSSVIAVIHPQGWLGVPPLMGLALVFALAREWRGSLLPPMIAHGINNGVSMTLLLVMAS